MKLVTGLVLADRYRLISNLGEGGMGQVWSASHSVTGRVVAIKQLMCDPKDFSFGEASARFALEARSACEVGHPNVVEVFDFIAPSGQAPFMVMELLKGETLAERFARGRVLSVSEAADLLLPVMSAVGTAHRRGIVHRDLKPSNIFLSPRPGQPPFVKVLDFGIAKWMPGSGADHGHKTRTGSTLGTPSYMAPEQATGERTVDHRVDIWALGVILYEAFAGVRPVEGESAAQLILRLLSSGIVPVEQLAPGLPAPIASMVGRMLTREVEARPADLREVFDAFRPYTRVECAAFDAPRLQNGEPDKNPVVEDTVDVQPRGGATIRGGIVGSKTGAPVSLGKGRGDTFPLGKPGRRKVAGLVVTVFAVAAVWWAFPVLSDFEGRSKVATPASISSRVGRGIRKVPLEPAQPKSILTARPSDSVPEQRAPESIRPAIQAARPKPKAIAPRVARKPAKRVRRKKTPSKPRRVRSKPKGQVKALAPQLRAAGSDCEFSSDCASGYCVVFKCKG